MKVNIIQQINDYKKVKFYKKDNFLIIEDVDIQQETTQYHALNTLDIPYPALFSNENIVTLNKVNDDEILDVVYFKSEDDEENYNSVINFDELENIDIELDECSIVEYNKLEVDEEDNMYKKNQMLEEEVARLKQELVVQKVKHEQSTLEIIDLMMGLIS